LVERVNPPLAGSFLQKKSAHSQHFRQKTFFFKKLLKLTIGQNLKPQQKKLKLITAKMVLGHLIDLTFHRPKFFSW
jgi:hypothetical protein